MPTYRERSVIAEDPQLIGRVANAAVKYAVYIQAAVPPPPAAEVALGLEVIANPTTYAKRMAYGVAANDFAGDGTVNDPLIDSAQGDIALSSVVETTLWPAFAG